MSKLERPMSKLRWWLLKGCGYSLLFATTAALAAAGTYLVGLTIKSITSIFN